MFEQVKAMGAIAGLMKDKERLREISERFRETLERIRANGSAGGGAVRVTVSGKFEVLDVFLDPSMVASMGSDDASRQMAQNLIADATNDALRIVREMIQEEVRKESEELGLPDIGLARNFLN